MQSHHYSLPGTTGASASDLDVALHPATSARLQVLLRPRMHPNFYPKPPAPGSGESRSRGFSQLVARWLDAFPDAESHPDVDFEDWVENAVALTTWMGAEGSVRTVGLDLFIERPSTLPVLQRPKNPVIEHFTKMNRPRAEFNPSAPFVLVGPELKVGDFVARAPGSMLPALRDIRVSEAYAGLPAFLQHAGRHVEMCASDDGAGDVDPQHEIHTVLRRMRDAGHPAAVVKVNETKAGIFLIDLMDRSDSQIQEALIEQLEWTLIGRAGQKDAFMVQALVAMQHEYRLVIVDGVIAAGAGCIEEFTPLDVDPARSSAFDERTRLSRGSLGREMSEVESRPDIVARYLAAAPGIVEDIIGDAPSGSPAGGLGPRTFVLDLCMIDGKVSIVELNPARNYGLYAMDYTAVYSQMEAAGRRHLACAEAGGAACSASNPSIQRRARP